ncbi:MAG: glycosyl hydrolase family 95 catalytic domain-containing protein, partial [Deltaproteobacteria bacterium]
ALILVAASSLSVATAEAEAGFKLTYDKPAAKWTEALPLGNGRIGAMVFGGTNNERLQINESTLWGGGPHDYTNPEAYAHLEEIRQLIFEGKAVEAERLSGPLMGRPKLLMPYQPFCDIRLNFPGHDQATEYRRELHLDNAVANVSYKIGAVEFRREVFVSYPDQVLVIRVIASQPGQIAFSVGLDSPQPGTAVESSATATLQLTGQIQPRQNPPQSWTGSWDQPGLRFAAVLKALTEGGSVRIAGEHLEISGANSVTILFSDATSFRNYHDISGDALATAQGYLQRASLRSYESLKQRHVEDFSRLFSRVELHLGEDRSNDSADLRIKTFSQTDDPSLLALYFAFGRYALISSSRPGGQPANLQGIWNQDLNPAWGSKMTTNINLEMNYWQADSGDLWETEEPLWNLVRDLRVTGAETARVHYHCKGWVLHHNTDLWRATTPIDGPWGIWPMGEAWLANQMWDHYEFSRNREFLARDAYPAMKEAAEFVLGFLVEAPAGTPFAGRLVTNPSTSPENRYFQDGKPSSLTYAATMDIELINELFENYRRAAEILGIDSAFWSELEKTRQRLPPLEIGKRGQLQEWIEDYAEVESEHRHVSHLYALYPGHDISLKDTPGFAAAAKKTLELRGDGGTGWSTVWRVALWARLQNPERAYTNLKLLIMKNTLPNMFDLCPPFQIDGNLGGPAAITEMLVQSTPEEIDVLPALPRQWPSGSLKGVRVRGGGKVDITWKGGQLTELRLQSDRAVKYRVRYGERSAEAQLRPGKPIALDGALHPMGR